MANKRMFTMKIVDSDAFLDMPLSTQALYFHLNMRADDDGFVGNPKKIQRVIGASDDDLRLLIAKRFVLIFESGVIVIKHWRMHNTLSTNRYVETVYIDEKELLLLKDNNAYSFEQGNEIDDSKKIESSKRLSKTQLQDSRRNIDATLTHLDIDKDLDLDIVLDKKEKNIIKKEKSETVESIIDNEFAYSEDLKLAMHEFVKMRKTIKKPCTPYAMKRLINKLYKLSNHDEAKSLDIVNQSIMCNYQDFYPLKEQYNQQHTDKGVNKFTTKKLSTVDEWAMENGLLDGNLFGVSDDKDVIDV